jgi:hypothetical protein
MDDIEYLLVDIDQTRSDEECGGSKQLFPLELLQVLNFFFRRDLLLLIIRIFIVFLLHFIAHFLQLNLNL